jgi:iron(III) transport system ATP-binding protein
VIVLDAEVTDGTAMCSLGVVPLANPGRATGNVRILLRPEQLAVLPAGDDAKWRLTRIQFAGSSAHVTLEGIAEPQRLTFETPGARLPPEGSLVSVAVLGGAHVLD